MDTTHAKPLEAGNLRAMRTPRSAVTWGDPQQRLLSLTRSDKAVEIGLWEMTRGGMRDIEIDEWFVVLDGEADLTVDGGNPIHIGPGSFVQLHAGDRTTWSTGTGIRKLFIAPVVEQES